MKSGEWYMIYNQTLKGRKIVEGKAKLVRRVSQLKGQSGEVWMVHFEGIEKDEKYPRTVHPKDKVEVTRSVWARTKWEK